MSNQNWNGTLADPPLIGHIVLTLQINQVIQVFYDADPVIGQVEFLQFFQMSQILNDCDFVALQIQHLQRRYGV